MDDSMELPLCTPSITQHRIVHTGIGSPAQHAALLADSCGCELLNGAHRTTRQNYFSSLLCLHFAGGMGICVLRELLTGFQTPPVRTDRRSLQVSSHSKTQDYTQMLCQILSVDILVCGYTSHHPRLSPSDMAEVGKS